MNCTEFDERITPAVDERLSADQASAFFEHATHCPGCRRAYEAERHTRSFIRQRMGMARTPGTVAAALMDRLAADQEPGRIRRVFRRSSFSARTAFAIAAVLAAISLISSPKFLDDNGLEQMREDVFAQSIVTYAGVVGGQMTPDVVSTQPEVLQAFFNGKTSFPVRVHAVRDCTPVGAMLHQSGGVPLAQVLYTSTAGTVYVYQTCWRTVQDGRKLHLPAHILATLRQGVPYGEENADGQSLVVWTEGSTLCGAVANMHTQELLAHLDVTPSNGMR